MLYFTFALIHLFTYLLCACMGVKARGQGLVSLSPSTLFSEKRSLAEPGTDSQIARFDGQGSSAILGLLVLGL